MTEIRDLLSFKLHRVANLLSRSAEMHYRREFDVSLWEWRTIALLGAADHPVSLGHLALVDRRRLRQVPERDRMFNLAQLNAAVTEPLTRTDRLRFLHAYFGRCRTLWTERARWVREIMRLTVARAHHWPARG